ncbi:MAG: uroporphyrinogen-III synthase [Acidobacteriaceae bacterium]
MAPRSFNGLRVLALETRRATEISKLIRTYGGEPTVASAMREAPLESNHEAFEFARRLLNREFDLVIFLTGVGARRLIDIVESRYERERILESLRRVKLAARGPKSSAALREMGLPVAVTAPEPCTWREVIGSLDGAFGPSLEGLRAAVQEYGSPNLNLLDALTQHHVEWTRVPVYQWMLPDDLEPLRNAVRSIGAGKIDVIVFLTAIQVTHLFQVAEMMDASGALLAGLLQTVVLSIGPSTSEELSRHGIEPDFEPSHPKMGFLMNESAECAARLLEEKRRAVSQVADLALQESMALATARANQAARPPETRHLNAIQLMHDIGRRMAVSDPLHAVLYQIVSFIETLLSCDSCFIYVLQDNQLVLRASKNPHPDVVDHLGLKVGQGITGWVAEHLEPVSISSGALRDSRFQLFTNLPEDSFEAFLSVPILARGGLVGVINVQHRQPHQYTPWEVQTISMVGFLVGAEIEMARLEGERDALTGQLESRKLIERAKGLLQRDHDIKEDVAYRMMQKESRQRRKSMREIAEAVILSEELRRAAAIKQP